MALQGSGQISFANIENEFGANGERSLGDYRVSENNGALSNMPLDNGIPQSGEIRFSSFYNKRLNIVVDCHSGGTEFRVDGRARYNGGGSGVRVVGGFRTRPSNSSGKRVFIHVNKSIGSKYDLNQSVCALRTGSWDGGTNLSVDVGGSGRIIGAGGNGGKGKSHGSNPHINGKPGNSGLGIQYDNTSVNVMSGGFICCGYGGGGGGGTGYNKDRGDPQRWGAGSGGGGGAGLPAGAGGEKSGWHGTGETGSDGTAGSTPSPGDNETGGRSGIMTYNSHWWEARGGLGGVGGPGGRQIYVIGGSPGQQYGGSGEYESGPESGHAGTKNGTGGGGTGANGNAIRKNSGVDFSLSNSGTVSGGTGTGVA